MMTPHEPIEIARLIASGEWSVKELSSYRERFGDAALLNVLLCPFLVDCSTESMTRCDFQRSAGALLLQLMPSSDRQLSQLLRESLSVWDPSVEEWPIFLLQRYGLRALSGEIGKLIKPEEMLDKTEISTLEALRGWLRTLLINAFRLNENDAQQRT